MHISPDPNFPIQTYLKHDMLVEGIKSEQEKKNILIKHLYENTEAFEIRVRRSAYRNFASPIVSAFKSAVFTEKPIRTLPESIQEFVEDCDKNQNDADNFFGDVVYNACKRGLHYVFVALPKTNPQTLEQAKAIGHRPYFVSVDAVNVIRYEENYCVIRNVSKTAETPFSDYEQNIEYSIWYKDRWEKYLVDADDELVLIDEGINNLGFIPLIPFYFRKKVDNVGVSALNDVDELIINLFRKDSELDKALFDNAIPLLFIKGLEDNGVDKIIKSTDNAFSTSSVNADAKYIESSGVSFEYLFKSIEALENSIREIALRSFKKNTTAVESAESKAIDKESFDNIVSNFAKNCEDAETLCWYVLALANNINSSDIKINYIANGDIKEISDKLLDVMQDLVNSKIISKDTLYTYLKDHKILPEDFDGVDEQGKIKNENYSLPLPTFNSN